MFFHVILLSLFTTTMYDLWWRANVWGAWTAPRRLGSAFQEPPAELRGVSVSVSFELQVFEAFVKRIKGTVKWWLRLKLNVKCVFKPQKKSLQSMVCRLSTVQILTSTSDCFFLLLALYTFIKSGRASQACAASDDCEGEASATSDAHWHSDRRVQEKHWDTPVWQETFWRHEATGRTVVPVVHQTHWLSRFWDLR